MGTANPLELGARDAVHLVHQDSGAGSRDPPRNDPVHPGHPFPPVQIIAISKRELGLEPVFDGIEGCSHI
jgi:hypothetical protein